MHLQLHSCRTSGSASAVSELKAGCRTNPAGIFLVTSGENLIWHCLLCPTTALISASHYCAASVTELHSQDQRPYRKLISVLHILNYAEISDDLQHLPGAEFPSAKTLVLYFVACFLLHFSYLPSAAVYSQLLCLAQVASQHDKLPAPFQLGRKPLQMTCISTHSLLWTVSLKKFILLHDMELRTRPGDFPVSNPWFGPCPNL